MRNIRYAQQHGISHFSKLPDLLFQRFKLILYFTCMFNQGLRLFFFTLPHQHSDVFRPGIAFVSQLIGFVNQYSPGRVGFQNFVNHIGIFFTFIGNGILNCVCIISYVIDVEHSG